MYKYYDMYNIFTNTLSETIAMSIDDYTIPELIDGALFAIYLID